MKLKSINESAAETFSRENDIGKSTTDKIQSIYDSNQETATEKELEEKHPTWSKEKRRAVFMCQIQGAILEYEEEELKADKDVVLAAVSSKGLALEHASDELKNDEDIVKRALLSDPEARDFVGDKLKNNFNFMFNLMNEGISDIMNQIDEAYNEQEDSRDDEGVDMIDKMISNMMNNEASERKKEPDAGDMMAMIDMM